MVEQPASVSSAPMKKKIFVVVIIMVFYNLKNRLHTYPVPAGMACCQLLINFLKVVGKIQSNGRVLAG
jgi:hypothetical protein